MTTALDQAIERIAGYEARLRRKPASFLSTLQAFYPVETVNDASCGFAADLRLLLSYVQAAKEDRENGEYGKEALDKLQKGRDWYVGKYRALQAAAKALGEAARPFAELAARITDDAPDDQRRIATLPLVGDFRRLASALSTFDQALDQVILDPFMSDWKKTFRSPWFWRGGAEASVSILLGVAMGAFLMWVIIHKGYIHP